MSDAGAIPSKPPEPDGARPPLLERLGVSYFRRLSASRPRPAQADEVHVLNEQEQRQMRRIVQRTVIGAAIAGVISAAFAAVFEVLADPLLGPQPEAATWGQKAQYWGVVGAAAGVAAAVEIAWLYRASLRAVHELAHAAGLELFPAQGEDSAVAAAMARAALELPNPNSQVMGVDPRRETSRLRLFVATILYKAKVSLTNFLAKLLVRRVFGRALVRTWLVPFIAIPVTAAWNAWVTWVVLREARVRAMGPSAAKEMVRLAVEAHGPMSAPCRLAAARAVASAIVRTEDLHPNLFAVLHEVVETIGEVPSERFDDPDAFLETLPKLDAADRLLTLRLLVVAAVIDGRFTKAERKLLRAAQAHCGRPADDSIPEKLRRAFVAGKSEAAQMVLQIE